MWESWDDDGKKPTADVDVVWVVEKEQQMERIGHICSGNPFKMLQNFFLNVHPKEKKNVPIMMNVANLIMGYSHYWDILL